MAVWAGLRLNAATIPTRMGVYYIAAGAGIALVGNLAWRMICEYWLLLFRMHTILASIERKISYEDDQRQMKAEDIHSETKRENVRPDVTQYGVASGRSVVGLS